MFFSFLLPFRRLQQQKINLKISLFRKETFKSLATFHNRDHVALSKELLGHMSGCQTRREREGWGAKFMAKQLSLSQRGGQACM